MRNTMINKFTQIKGHKIQCTFEIRITKNFSDIFGEKKFHIDIKTNVV